jgi:hypothetical protein
MLRLAMALGALGLLVAYLFRPPTLRDTIAISECLPPGITLSTVVEYRPTGKMVRVKNTIEPVFDEVTVEQELAKVGARASGGKLYDAGGKEIRIFKGYGGGAKPPPQMMQSEQAERRRLKSLYTLIEVAPFDPRHPPQ